ncbi:MAG: 1-acyl-sn-glycerol-3-phosphate acyltransferase [Bacteroidales bacterium]
MNQETENKNNTQITEEFLSLEKILASKNKSLVKFMPKFLLNRFKKLVHLDEINSAIYEYKFNDGTEFATKIIENYFKAKIEIVNPENIPPSGRQLLIANHPLGGADGLALMSAIGGIRKDVLFPVNDILSNIPALNTVFIPINKYGSNTENHKIFDKAFEGEKCILFFPAGMVSRKKKGVISDLVWHKTFLKKSIKHKRDIVPIFVDAINSKRFYRWANFREKLGIKFNIELILLPDEMFKQKGKTITLIFGKPIPYTIFDKSRSMDEWVKLIREHVYKLKYSPNEEFEIKN